MNSLPTGLTEPDTLFSRQLGKRGDLEHLHRQVCFR